MIEVILNLLNSELLTLKEYLSFHVIICLIPAFFMKEPFGFLFRLQRLLVISVPFSRILKLFKAENIFIKPLSAY